MKPHKTFSSVVLAAPSADDAEHVAGGTAREDRVERGKAAETNRHVLHLEH